MEYFIEILAKLLATILLGGFTTIVIGAAIWFLKQLYDDAFPSKD